MKPSTHLIRSLDDIFNASFNVTPATFLTANESSLPANNPINDHVVDIGILDNSLNTKRTTANRKFTNVASGTSPTLAF